MPQLGRMSLDAAGFSFGELLRDQRRAAGMTQEELAERSGLSVRSISDLERGSAHVPRRDSVDLIVRALGLDTPARTAFEALVDRRRGPRPDQAPGLEPPPADAQANHNLPRQLTSFVGREGQRTELARALAASPLLTLTGAGGVGKTRLALELVRDHSTRYTDGVWLVELAGLADPSLVPSTVASVLGMVEPADRTIVAALVDYIKPRHLLLVLDNCEHLIQACAELTARLLRDCPGLHVVATSREALATPGEVTWVVPPLELPDLEQSVSLDSITGGAAVRLFVDRARAMQSSLALTDQTVRAIARICIRLDGIPLAIELAAARLRAMTVEELAARLDGDRPPPVGNRRTGQPHHQTLRATIQWSYHLLDQHEQALFRRLSVFAGGWTLRAAEEVCSGQGIEPTSVVDLVTQLVDKSMVLLETRLGMARYRFLEPIRQFALEQLESSGEVAVWRARHADGVLALAVQGEAQLAGREEITSLDRLELEHDNVRLALRWFVALPDGESALRLSTAMWRFWERRGHYQEGCGWLDRALAGAATGPAATRGNALNALAMLHWATGHADVAGPLAEQALGLCRTAGDGRGVAWALISLGMIAYYQNDPQPALAQLEESVPLARTAADMPLLSLALSCLGRVLLWANGPDEPRALSILEQSLSQAQGADSHHARGQALSALGELAWRRGDAEHATRLWKQALELRRQLRDRRGTATNLRQLGLAAAACGQLQRAAWLWGAAASQRAAIGLELRHDEQAEQAQLVATATQKMGEAAFTAAWTDGQAASVEDAVTRALEADCRRRPGSATAAARGAGSI